MSNLKISVRLVVIKNGKVLLINNKRDGFYYFIGGGVEYGETFEIAAARELREEAGMDDINFEYEKLLYIQEMVFPDRHKIEIFIKGTINKSEELEGVSDPGHDVDDYLTWINVNELPEKLLPLTIAERFSNDFDQNFDNLSVPVFTKLTPDR